MRANDVIPLLGPFSLLVVQIAGCGSSQKPFDQMTAEEHRAAAARELDLAAAASARVTGEDIEPPEVPSAGLYYYDVYEEYGGAVPYTYEPYVYSLNGPEAYIAWPRISDPSEKYEDAASEHLENAMRHERRAALLEGRPSPQPLPPDRPNEQLLDDSG
jgi:hypothetical protein